MVKHTGGNGSDDELLSSAEVAGEFAGVSQSTAYRRILRAAKRGDARVRFVGRAWVAPRAWWRDEFRRRPPKRPGRPPERPAGPRS